MNLLDLLKELGLNPKRKAASHGGEYCSPCPFCRDGDDRFLIWPSRPNKDGGYQRGRFSCRVCGRYGDAINFLCLLYGLTYKEACARLRLELKPRNERVNPKTIPPAMKADDPPMLWQVKAKAFIDWCHAQLTSDLKALEQIKRRGFSQESIVKFKLGFNPGERVPGSVGRGHDFFREREDWGLEHELKEDGKPRKLWLPIGFVIPTFSFDSQVIKVKIRRSAWHEGDKMPKYVEVSGSKKSPSVYGSKGTGAALIQESELDSLLIQQEAPELVFCVALGGSTKPLDLDTETMLRNTRTLLFCPDFDAAGKLAWDRWKTRFPQTQRILTPDGKAPGDAFLAGINLHEWIFEALRSKETSNQDFEQ